MIEDKDIFKQLDEILKSKKQITKDELDEIYDKFDVTIERFQKEKTKGNLETLIETRIAVCEKILEKTKEQLAEAKMVQALVVIFGELIIKEL